MLKNIGANWTLAFLKIASAFVLMPFVIRALGTVEYGVWILIGSATGYMALLILGVPATSVRFMAQAIASKDHDALNTHVASFTGLYLLLGGICAIVGITLYFAFTVFFVIPPDLLFKAKLACTVVIVTTSTGFILQLPYAIFSAHHEFVIANIILAATTLFKFVATILILHWLPSIVVVAVIQLGTQILEFVIAWYFVRKKYPYIRLGIPTMKWLLLKQILAFSIFVLILNVGSQLSYQTDALVIGKFLDVGKIAFFSVASSLTLYYLEFLVGIASVVFPMATKLQTENNQPALQEMFLKWSKIALALTMVGGLYLLFLGPRFLAWWVGEQFEVPSGQVLQILLLGFFVYLPVRAVAQPMLMGMGRPNEAAYGFLVAGVANLILSIALAAPFGLIGIAIGTAIPNVLYALYLVYAACRSINLPATKYFSYVYGKATLAAIPVILLLVMFRNELNVQKFWEFAATAAATVALCVVLWFGFIIRNDPYLGDSWRLLRARLTK